MNEWHLGDAFAPVPPVVRERIDDALTEVHGMSRKHRNPVLAVVLAALVTLALAGTAVAAGIKWGALDFLSAKEQAAEALPEAREALLTEVAQEGGVTEWAAFTLREALCDGRYAWLVFDVVPTEADTLLMAGGLASNVPANQYSPELPEDMTVAQWAKANGYARILMVSIEQEAKGGSAHELLQNLSWHSEADGAVSLMFWTSHGPEEGGEKSFVCSVRQWWESDANPHRPVEAVLTANLEPAPEPLWMLEWTGEAALPDSDIVVEAISLTGTVVGLYGEITYAAPEPDRDHMYPWVYLVGEQGKRLEWSAGLTEAQRDGIIRSGERIDRLEDGRYQSFGCYAPLAEPPETVWVSGMIMDDGRRLEAVEIPLQ